MLIQPLFLSTPPIFTSSHTLNMDTNATTDQITMLQNLLAAVNALKDSVGIAAPKTSSKTSRAKKVKDPNAPKRALNPKIAAQNQERKKIYEEMQEHYFMENPSAEGMDPKEIRKMAKEGKLPPFPTYPQALKEHSRRMRAADPEHDKKAQAYRDRIDAKQAETKKEKGSKKTSEASSIASGNSETAAEIITEDAAAASPLPPSPPPPPAPAQAPAPAPAAEEKKPRGRPKKMTIASAPAPASEPQPEITVTSQTSDPEEFNMNLKMPDGKTYLLNAKNWVLSSEDQEWAGIYDPAKKMIDTNAPEPQ
jgi:hypothetical protein